MKNLFKNLLPYKKTVVLIALLVVAQCYCDMTIPQYTQDLIDVGIMNGGVEHIVPSRIEKDEYQKAQTFMNDEQKATWQGLYEENGDIYKLTVNDEKELDKIDEELLKPIVIIYQLEQMQDPEVKEKINGMLSSGMMNNPAAMEEASKKMDEMIATVGDRTLKSMGIAYAKNCNKEAGLDAARMQQNYLWVCGGKMLLLTAFMVVIAAITSFLSSRVGASIGRNLRKEVFSNVMGYSNAEMDKFTTSSLITRATNDIQQVQMTSTMILRMVLMAPIMAAWGIVKVYQTKAHMSYIIVIGVIILVSLIGIVLVVTLPKFRIMQKLIDALNAVSREILTGVPVIRAFGREKTEEERFDVANKKLKDTQLFVNRVMTLLSPFMLIIMYGITIVITWVSAKKIDAGTLQVGAMTAFITYSMMIITSFLIITGMAIILPRAGVAADRIEEVRGTKTSITNRKGAVELKDCKGVVRFNNVSFKYPDADENVVSNISFDALPGQTTALIGSTGSGKSTIINLIPRFYDVTEGSIEIDGRDIREYTIESLRKAIGLVPQKGILFSGTIASNIRFGNSAATDEEVKEFAAIAQAEDFIDEKEDKYDSFIAQGGANVSGGQKQRLSIARALAKKPVILIFDDSFSALDMKTDAELRKELAEKQKDATKIIVAQRVGTILHAEQIIVLEDGEIVGRGTHEELIKSCEIYRQIAESQLSKSELEGVR